MAERSVASNVRRISSQRGRCALVALVSLLLAFAHLAVAQDLRLQPAEPSGPSDSTATTNETTPPDTASPDANAKNAESPAADSNSDTLPAPADSVSNPDSNLAIQAPDADTSGTASSANNSAAAPSRSNSAGGKSAAPPPETVDLRVALERPGTLNLHNVELRAALFMISEQWGINVVSGEVKGSVNGVFREAPLREILDSILLSNGYNYRAVGESLVVSSVEELGQINPFFQSATIPVRSADIDEVVQGAKLLTTPKGQIQAIKSARSIVVLDFPDRVKMIRDFVTTIDNATRAGSAGGSARLGQPLKIGYFRTQFISAKTAEDALVPVLSKEGKVAILEKEDRLLVSDYQENLDMIATVLKRIDIPRPQVRITALIYDISLQDIEQLGINWRSAVKGNTVNADGDPNSLFGVDSIMQVPFESGATGSALTFMNLSKHLDITAVVLALNNAKDARLLANPSAAVLENEEALFQSVSEIPYQQLTQTSQGGNIGTTAFKEAGITLRCRPKIAADGNIRMEVAPEFSRLTGFTPGDHQPIIDRRTAETTISVCNRQTVVIGGLRQREDVGDFKGVPYLKDMRVVGKLFRSRDTNVRESELVVFISPEIISAGDPLGHREQMVVDTLGCRLNQIPEAEGCPPPCGGMPPCDFEPPCAGPPLAGPVRLPPAENIADATASPANVNQKPQPVAVANADSEPKVTAPPTTAASATVNTPAVPTQSPGQTESPPTFVNVVSPVAKLGTNMGDTPSSVRRLPTLDQVQMAATPPAPPPLFQAPPRFDSGTPTEVDSSYRVGGAVQVGRPSVSDRRMPVPRRW